MYHVYAVDEGKPCRIDIPDGLKNFVAEIAGPVTPTTEGGLGTGSALPIPEDSFGIRIPFKPYLYVLTEGFSPRAVDAYIRRNPKAGTIVEKGFRDEVEFVHPQTYVDYGYFKEGTNEWVSYVGLYPTIFDTPAQDVSDVSFPHTHFYSDPKPGPANEAWRLLLPQDEAMMAGRIYIAVDEYKHIQDNREHYKVDPGKFNASREFLEQLGEICFKVNWKEAPFETIIALVKDEAEREAKMTREGSNRMRGKESF